MFIALIMITGAAYAVNFVKEYDTNAPIPDDEWNQYRWQGEWTDFRTPGAGAVQNVNYKWGEAIQLPPGTAVQYNLIFPPTPGASYHVKHGIYRLFFYGDTTNAGVQQPVQISVYVDFDFIQIQKSVISPATNGHCGVIDVGWIDFSDENHTIPQPGAPGWHWIEIANLDQNFAIIIDEIVISTAN